MVFLIFESKVNDCGFGKKIIRDFVGFRRVSFKYFNNDSN